MEVAPQPGSVLNERYRLIRPLARGGMGSVWCAEHLTLGSQVAVKIIDPELAREHVGLSRFMREARALAALHSPFIVQVLDFGSEAGMVYIVMELLEGKTLGQRLKAEGKLSPHETRRILGDVCKGMGHAHERGVVHRDLKPDNIFLCDATREHIVKVLDFGIAKPRGLESITNTDPNGGAFLGTPSYMSPEQCRGQAIDARSDLWALGAIAYECLTGKRLYMGTTLGDVVVRICSGELPIRADVRLPAGFRGWLERALALDPARRFASASELSAALTDVLGAAPRGPDVDAGDTLAARVDVARAASVPAAPGTLARGTMERAARRTEGHRWTTWGGVAAALVAALALVVVARGVSSPGAEARSERQRDHERVTTTAVAASEPGRAPATGAPSTPPTPPTPPSAGADADAGAEPERRSTVPSSEAPPPRPERSPPRPRPEPEMEPLRKRR